MECHVNLWRERGYLKDKRVEMMFPLQVCLSPLAVATRWVVYMPTLEADPPFFAFGSSSRLYSYFLYASTR